MPKISSYPTASLTDDDVFVVVDSGVTKKGTLAALKAYLGGGAGVNPTSTPVRVVTSTDKAFSVKSPRDAYDLFVLDTTPLQSGGVAQLYMRAATGTSIVGPLIRVDDAGGAWILQLYNDDGLFVNDSITMSIYDVPRGYHRGVGFGYLNAAANALPALIFGSNVAANAITNLDYKGTNRTIDTGKGLWMRWDEVNDRIQWAGDIVPAANNTFRLGAALYKALEVWATTLRPDEITFPSTVKVLSQSTLLNGGIPEGQQSAPVGSLCASQNGYLYRKVTGSGNTGWEPVPPFRTPPVERTVTSYTLTAGEEYAMCEFNNASAITVTVPTNASVPFAIGAQIPIRQTGAGQITIAAASGVTIRSRVGMKFAGQWSEATLTKRNTDEWVLSGDVTA